MNKGMVLLKRCFISECIKGEKRIPLKPLISPGLTPKLLKLTPNRTSAQNTIQIKRTNNIGNPMVPVVKTKGVEAFKFSSILINITKKHPNYLGCKTVI